jgi:predicted O-methyltransferase YrrM
MAEAVAGLEDPLGVDLSGYLDDPELADAQQRLRGEVARIPADSPLPRTHLSDPALGRLLYVLCRALRPSVVVETGVAYGQSSALILSALEANGAGTLHSIDLAPGPEAAAQVGALVPAEFRDRWRLHEGASRRVLPRLLVELGGVDLFLHDSRHSYLNVLRELRTVRPHLKPPGVVVADDIERHSAWARWVAETAPGYAAVVQEASKPGYCGTAVLGRAQGA